jgi:type VI secretion system protein ImpA
MRHEMDVQTLTAPLPGDKPAGEDLRYTAIYEEIQEARRADDPFDRGDWQREIKTSDWDKVITLSLETLSKKTKDLQIAAWLTEALAHTDRFQGLSLGLEVTYRYLQDFWDSLYPEIEEGDLEFRAAPFEFLNDKLWVIIRQIPLTDPQSTPGYSWLKWQESRQVGYEKDTRNQYGDVDENKRKGREELLSEGKLSAEEFDGAVALSSEAFYESLSSHVKRCREGFSKLDRTIDEKFGPSAPRLAEWKAALEDCDLLVSKILKDKIGDKPTESEQRTPEPTHREKIVIEKETRIPSPSADSPPAGIDPPAERPWQPVSVQFEPLSTPNDIWPKALQVLHTSGIRSALEELFAASCRAPSNREKNNFRLLMAKLCLKADRKDLARPIVEELHALIEEHHLERWESPTWIGEVLDALYQCLVSGEPSDEDRGRAGVLLRKLCTIDVTKAMTYRS